MAVEVRNNAEKTRYEVLVDGAVAGFTEYHPYDGLLAFPHTEVDPAYAGQGLAKTVVQAALDDVRSQGLQLLPFCPLVRGFIAKNPEYVDLVPEEKREQFGLA